MKGKRETLGEGSRYEKLQSTQDFKLKLSQSEVCQTTAVYLLQLFCILRPLLAK